MKASPRKWRGFFPRRRYSGGLGPETPDKPIKHRGQGETRAGCERVDDEVLQPCMSPGRPELRDLERAGQRHRDDRGYQPMLPVAEAEGQTDQQESQRMLAVLAESGVRTVAGWTERGERDGGGEQPGG